MGELFRHNLFQASELKAYYRFEGNSNDSSPSGYNGTDTSMVYGIQYGRFEIGALFNGANYITLPDNEALRITGDMSFGAWILPTTITGMAREIMVCTAHGESLITNALYLAQINANGKLYVGHEYGSGANEFYESTNVLFEINKAYHVVVTRNTATKKYAIYVNGEFVEELSYTNQPAKDSSGNTQRVSIGYDRGVNTYYFVGNMDDAFIFDNKILTAEEIKELYSERSSYGEIPPRSTLQLYWKLNGNAFDSSGKNNHATITNATIARSSGKFLQGANLDGTNDFIQKTLNAAAGGKNTISFWTKFDDTTKQQFVIGFQAAGAARRYKMGLRLGNTAGLLHFFCSSGDTTGVESGVTAILNDTTSWHNVVLVSDKTATPSAKIYIDGRLADITVVLDNCNNDIVGGTVFSIGRDDGDTARDFDGQIDEVIVDATAWSPQEIRNYYNQAKGAYVPKIV